jgi:hypothetical protein
MKRTIVLLAWASVRIVLGLDSKRGYWRSEILTIRIFATTSTAPSQITSWILLLFPSLD